jgi:hypothetical protein
MKQSTFRTILLPFLIVCSLFNSCKKQDLPTSTTVTLNTKDAALPADMVWSPERKFFNGRVSALSSISTVSSECQGSVDYGGFFTITGPDAANYGFAYNQDLYGYILTHLYMRYQGSYNMHITPARVTWSGDTNLESIIRGEIADGIRYADSRLPPLYSINWDRPMSITPNWSCPNNNPEPVQPPLLNYELPRDIKIDSLNKKFPCVVKTVINALKANSKFYALVQPFDEIHLPNGQKLTVQDLPNLEFDAKPLTWGTANQYKLGETGRTPGNVGGSIIAFNSSAITNASKLMIQTTAIHEAGHAYANYYIKYGSWGFPIDTARYSTWALDIVNFQSASRDQKNNPNFYDHSTFLENYFDNMVSILKDINGSEYTDKQYQMAVLYGMDNAGIRPTTDYLINGISHYDILRSAQLSSFEAIKTKYGITTADLSTFNQANILNVPNNQKVPTNCP